jgi:hypothetical protein
MKIKRIEVIFTWEDDSIHAVTDYLPAGLFADLENFADYWEQEHGEEEAEDEQD